MSTNPEKTNLEAASSSETAAAKKSRFRPTFRTPRIPRETKLGLGIIFSLVCVFGYVLYSRLTRPTDLDPEQYVAQGESLLAPSVTNGQATNLPVQPAAHSPTILPGTAPHNALPLTNPANNHGAVSNYTAPAGGAGQTAWAPNSSAGTTPSSDPFMNRGAGAPTNSGNPAANFSANGFNANSTPSNVTPSVAKQPAATGYGASDNSDAIAGPSNSFLPPPERATSGSTALSATVSPDHAATTGALNEPTNSVATGNVATRSVASSATSTSPVDAFNKSATDSVNKLRQEGQDLVNSGTTTQQNLSKAADSANQMLGQAQQQLGQYTNSTGTNANSLLNQANQAASQYGTDMKASATQYGADLKTGVQNQATQYTNQLRNTSQDQFQQAQNQLRSSANNLVNDTTNQLNAGTQSVMTKAGESTQNLMNSASTALQPLSPTSTPASGMTQPASGYGMPAAAPRTLDPSQTASQPLSASNMNSAYSASAQPEQPIRIPTEPSSFTAQPTATPQPSYGTPANVAAAPSYGTPTAPAATPNYGAAPTSPNYGTSPTYGTPATPATGGTPLQFNQPTMPAAQPNAPVYGGATRTNFEQPAATATRGVQQYTVTGQDSYFSVAEKMYGNGQFNKALYEYNRRNNPAADRLQVGGAMLIPDLGTLQEQFPDLVPSTAAAATATNGPTPLQFPR